MRVFDKSFWVIVCAVCAFGCSRLHAKPDETSGEGGSESTTATNSSTTATDDTADQGGGGEGGADAAGGTGGVVDTTTATDSGGTTSTDDTGTNTNTGTTTSTVTDSGTTTPTVTDTNTTTSTVTDSGTTTDTGTTTSTAAPVGKIMIVAVPLDQTVVSMPMQFQGQDDKYGLNINQSTAPDSIGAASFKAARFEIDVEAGKTLVFNGLTNVGQPNAAWWCSGANTVSLIIGAFWNADADNANSAYVTATVVPAPNGQGGCNLTVIAASAASAVLPAIDADGDGYAVNAAIQAEKDCDDLNPLAHPNQLESWGDDVDFNCKGLVDPPSWKYTAKDGSIVGKVNAQVVDTNSWSNQLNDFAVTYPMVWNQATQAFEVSIGSWKAPTSYVVRYKVNVADVIWLWTPWNQSGACQTDGIALQVSESEYGTVVPFTMTLIDQCHLHKS